MGGLASVIGSGVTGVISGMFGRSEAQKNRDFQEDMSNTAYQRAARDLEAAGLNRVLALGSPATTPAGAIGSMSMPDLGASYVGGSTAQQNIAESKTRQTQISAHADNLAADLKRIQSEASVANVKSTLWQSLEPLAEKIKAWARSVDLSDATLKSYLDRLDSYVEERVDGALEALRSLGDSITDNDLVNGAQDFVDGAIGIASDIMEKGSQIGASVSDFLTTGGGDKPVTPRERKSDSWFKDYEHSPTKRQRGR